MTNAWWLDGPNLLLMSLGALLLGGLYRFLSKNRETPPPLLEQEAPKQEAPAPQTEPEVSPQPAQIAYLVKWDFEYVPGTLYRLYPSRIEAEKEMKTDPLRGRSNVRHSYLDELSFPASTTLMYGDLFSYPKSCEWKFICSYGGPWPSAPEPLQDIKDVLVKYD